MFDFERLNPARFEEAFDLLENGNVLVGTFAITKRCFSLEPEDVYDAKNGDDFETVHLRTPSSTQLL